MGYFISKNATIKLINPIDDSVLLTIDGTTVMGEEGYEYTTRRFNRSRNVERGYVKSKATIQIGKNASTLLCLKH
jgi:hypothetical protein